MSKNKKYKSYYSESLTKYLEQIEEQEKNRHTLSAKFVSGDILNEGTFVPEDELNDAIYCHPEHKKTLSEIKQMISDHKKSYYLYLQAMYEDKEQGRY